MRDGFTQILKEHLRKYPLMEPQDFGKLAYQSAFGPEHLIADSIQKNCADAQIHGSPTVGKIMMQEWQELVGESTPRMPEAIGGQFCRFPLSACESADAVELLAELFIASANKMQGSTDGIQGNADGMQEKEDETQGNAAGLQIRLEQIERLKIAGMAEWMTEWKQKGCPPVHHSETYRNAYHPHYRLLRKAYADYFPALLALYQRMKQDAFVIASIDGRCGSGKTQLAALIEDIFPCQVIHMDDFYLPFAKRQENWMELAGGNMDFERLQTEILHPLRTGGQAVYRPYNCREDRMGEPAPVKPCKLILVEGSYSQHPLLAEVYDVTIFLTCGSTEQRERLLVREGSYFPAFEKYWIPMEENYLKQCNTEAKSHIVINTSGFF